MKVSGCRDKWTKTQEKKKSNSKVMNGGGKIKQLKAAVCYLALINTPG